MTCPVTVTRNARWWPWDLPSVGHHRLVGQVKGLTPLPLCRRVCLGEADAVAGGVADVGVVQEQDALTPPLKGTSSESRMGWPYRSIAMVTVDPRNTARPGAGSCHRMRPVPWPTRTGTTLR